MATPQRNLPDEPRREPKPELRRVDREIVPTQRSNGMFWIWIVLFIAAIVWFCGWGFGGYGGWWWGHSPAMIQPANTNQGGPAGAGGTGSAAQPPAGSNHQASPQQPANTPPQK